MPGLRADVDPDGLLEYSVVYSDRSLNHMSASFQQVMNDLSATLKNVYQADGVAVVPGSGTYGMEAIARQFARDQRCLIIRNGWFSYRWTQILETARLTDDANVMMAAPQSDAPQAPFAPAPIDQVVAQIQATKPQVVFAPHVETSAGMILPDDYLKAVADAVHQVGGLFVLDCIASGAIWVDMQQLGVDVLVTAPQKGWSGSPCSGLVMMNQRALQRLEETTSDSFACDLKKWYQIMQAYENGGHAYHATMPTDALRATRDVISEMQTVGFDELRQRQQQLGSQVRAELEAAGFPSVAASGFQAPGVVVSYTDRPEVKSGQMFREAGIQIAAGVPLACNEPEDFQTFRIGLFGLDKLMDVPRTVQSLKQCLAG